jgi:hypothetical protein
VISAEFSSCHHPSLDGESKRRENQSDDIWHQLRNALSEPPSRSLPAARQPVSPNKPDDDVPKGKERVGSLRRAFGPPSRNEATVVEEIRCLCQNRRFAGSGRRGYDLNAPTVGLKPSLSEEPGLFADY